LDWAVRGLLDSFLLCSHDQFPDTPSFEPCARSPDTPAWTASDSLLPLPHHVRNNPVYFPMASWWPYMELPSKGPLVGNPGRIHAQYPGDTFSPFPNFPPLPTFCYPEHDYIVLHMWSRRPSL
jgi:hypothetical protein